MKRIFTSIAVSATLAASAFVLAGSSSIVAKHGADDPVQIEDRPGQIELVGKENELRHGKDDPAELQPVGRGGDDGAQIQFEPRG